MTMSDAVIENERALIFDSEKELGEYLSTIRVPSEILGISPEATNRYYEWCLKNGGIPQDSFSETLAIWFSRQSSVGSKATDRGFQEGQIGRYRGDEPWLVAAKKKYRKATGHDVPSGAVYCSQVARFPNDPKAWVRDRSELAARARATGRGIAEMGIEAAEAIDTRTSAPKLDEALVQRHLRKAVADPSNIGKDVRELRHNIVQKHAFNSKE